MAFLEKNIHYKEWTDPHSDMPKWKLTKRGLKKVKVFQDQAELWHKWLVITEPITENLVNPMTMGIDD